MIRNNNCRNKCETIHSKTTGTYIHWLSCSSTSQSDLQTAEDPPARWSPSHVLTHIRIRSWLIVQIFWQQCMLRKYCFYTQRFCLKLFTVHPQVYYILECISRYYITFIDFQIALTKHQPSSSCKTKAKATKAKATQEINYIIKSGLISMQWNTEQIKMFVWFKMCLQWLRCTLR